MSRVLLMFLAITLCVSGAFAEQRSLEFQAKFSLCERWSASDDGSAIDQVSLDRCLSTDEPIFGFSHEFFYPISVGQVIVKRVVNCGGSASVTPDPHHSDMMIVTVSNWWSLYHLSSPRCLVELLS